MTVWSRRIPFQVDVAGVIQIMGTSLYSRYDAPLRELIQNAHDAVLRRRQLDLTYQGRIDIRYSVSGQASSTRSISSRVTKYWRELFAKLQDFKSAKGFSVINFLSTA